MASLINIPPQKVFVEPSAVSDSKEILELEAYWHAITIESNRSIKCHVLFECGAHYSDLSLSSLYSKRPSEVQHFVSEFTEPYAALSSSGEVVVLRLLEQMQVETRSCGKGVYLFTLQFLGRELWQNIPEQRKLYHFIKLDNGQFAALPNNKILWVDEAVTDIRNGWPKWIKRNSQEG